jgi:hypothetical protein
MIAMRYMPDPNHLVNKASGVSIADTLGIGGIQLAAMAAPSGSDRVAGAAPPPAGHNSGAGQPLDDDARKAYFVAAITDWIANRRQRAPDYMQPNEIGAAKRRASLLLRSIVDGIAFIYREHIGSDERGNGYLAGLYIVDTVFSNNENGCSTASAPRVAALLGCSEKSVRRARDLLVDNSVLGCEKRRGVGDRYWPIINRKLAAEENHVVWWLDATSEATKRGRPPEKARTDTVQTFETENPGPKPATPDPCGPPLEKTPDPKQKTPDPDFGKRPTHQGVGGVDFSYTSIREDGASAPVPELPLLEPAKPSPSKRAPAKPKATEEQFGRFWAAYPRKEGKAAAKRNFLALTREDAEHATSGAAAEARKQRGKDPRYIKWPQRWLSERQFEDYVDQPQANGPAAPELSPYWWQRKRAPEVLGSDMWQRLIKAHGNPWSEKMLGPSPGVPGCVVPADVIDKLDLARAAR